MYMKIITAFLITIKLIDPIPYSLIWMVNWLTETVNRSIHLCINWSYSALINPTRYINCMFTNFNVKPTSFCGCDVSQVTSCPTPSTGSGSGESSSSGEGSSSREASCSFGEVVDSALAFYSIRYYLWKSTNSAEQTNAPKSSVPGCSLGSERSFCLEELVVQVLIGEVYHPSIHTR